MKPREQDLAIDDEIDKTAIELRREKGLEISGSGGQMMNDIQVVHLEFHYYHLVDIQEARSLIVYTIQKILKNINEDKKVRPYLHNYPFGLKNIKVILWINQPDGYPPPQGNIQIISLSKGAIIYELTAPSRFEPWPILHQESYEDAVKLVEVNSQR